MAVYFAQAGGYTKIGYSHDPLKRADTITRSGTCPDDLPFGAEVKLIGWVTGDRRVEADIFCDFGDSSVAGEWFLLGDDDHALIREMIWADPCGVDLDRMSALAVFAAADNPGATRDEIEAAGIPVLAKPLEEVLASIGDKLTECLNRRRAS